MIIIKRIIGLILIGLGGLGCLCMGVKTVSDFWGKPSFASLLTVAPLLVSAFLLYLGMKLMELKKPKFPSGNRRKDDDVTL